MLIAMHTSELCKKQVPGNRSLSCQSRYCLMYVVNFKHQQRNLLKKWEHITTVLLIVFFEVHFDGTR